MMLIIDFVADTTYQDYGLRVRRNGVSGGNGVQKYYIEVQVILILDTDEAAPIVFTTTGAERFKVSSVGAIEWGGHTGTISTGGITSGVIFQWLSKQTWNCCKPTLWR